MASHVDALAAVTLFSRLGAAQRERIADKLLTRHYSRGDLIFEQGDPGGELYIIDSGSVHIGMTAHTGKEVILAALEPGDAFGELALLDAGTRSADARAVEDTTLLILKRTDFDHLLEAEPQLYPPLLTSLAGMVRNADRKLADVAFLDVHARMAGTLLSLAKRHGKQTERGVTIDRETSAGELAALMGLYEAEVARLLRDYQYENIIAVNGPSLTLLKPETLESWLPKAAVT